MSSDLARGQRLEHDRRKRRETQAPRRNGPSNRSGGQRPRRSHRLLRARQSLGFVGRVHGEAVEVFRKAGLNRGFRTVFEHEAGDFVITSEDLFVR